MARELINTATTVTPDGAWAYTVELYREHLAVPTPDPVPTPPPPVLIRRPLLGVNIHPMWKDYDAAGVRYKTHLDLLWTHGVRALRIDYGMSGGFEKGQPWNPRSWYNARFLTALKLATDRGFQILPVVHQSPDWMRPGTTAGQLKQFPTDQDAWKRFWREFGLVMKAQPNLMALQIWNEPNLAAFTGVPDPGDAARRYARLMVDAVDQLNLLGVRSAFGAPSQCDADWTQLVIDVATVLPTYGAVHPYQGDARVPPDDNRVSVPTKARVNHYPHVAALFPGRPMLWTEFGYSVHANDAAELRQPWLVGVDEATASKHLVAQIDLAARRWHEVGAVFVYAAWDPTGTKHARGYSLITADNQPTPRLLALRDYYAEE
jgi:hypothetical protein